MKNTNKIFFILGILGIAIFLVLSGCVEKKPEVNNTSNEKNETKENLKPSEEDNKKPVNRTVAEIYCDLDCKTSSPYDVCFDFCLKKQNETYSGILEKGISYCDDLKNVNALDFDACIDLTAAHLKNYSLCERSANKDKCTMVFGYATENVSVCKKTLNSDSSDKCISAIAALKDNVSLCDESSYAGAKEDCITEVAKAKGDITLCKSKGLSKRSVSLCIISLAKEKGNADFCDDDMLELIMRNVCIQWVAVETKNKAVCKKISDQNQSLYCEALAS